MKKRTRILITLLIIGGLIGGFGYWHFMSPIDKPFTEYEQIKLDRFPLSLELLYHFDNLEIQQTRLNQIRTGSIGGVMNFLVVYPNFFHPCHSPATLKWYLYPNRILPLSIPIPGKLSVKEYGFHDTVKIVNGTEFYWDVSVSLKLSPYISLELAHAGVNKSLADRYFSNHRAILIQPNEIFAITLNNSGLDFAILDTEKPNFEGVDYDFQTLNTWKNPYYYFSDTVKAELFEYYNLEYIAMQESGLFPESRFNHTANINEKGTPFGIWYYENGPLILNENHHRFGWYSFDGAIVNMLNVNRTDKTTFWKEKISGLPFNSSMIGMYFDGKCTLVEGYPTIGLRYMYQIEELGDEGIIRIDHYIYGNESRPDSLFMRYKIESPGLKWDKDILKLEYFNDLETAQLGFTVNYFLYSRLPTKN